MNKCIKHRLTNIFSFSDTAGRLDYFCTWLGMWLFLIGIFMLIAGNTISQFMPILIIFLFIINIANVCRRLNDIGKSRLFALLLFIPIVGLIFFIYLLATPGKIK
jgi:uncharacterized membrane protein YhaH (DUF805 family)